MEASQSHRQNLPPGGSFYRLRYILPFNVPGLSSNLGREDDILPYGLVHTNGTIEPRAPVGEAISLPLAKRSPVQSPLNGSFPKPPPRPSPGGSFCRLRCILPLVRPPLQGGSSRLASADEAQLQHQVAGLHRVEAGAVAALQIDPVVYSGDFIRFHGAQRFGAAALPVQIIPNGY